MAGVWAVHAGGRLLCLALLLHWPVRWLARGQRAVARRVTGGRGAGGRGTGGRETGGRAPSAPERAAAAPFA
ncbi:hypothetical protein [Streptomyces huiliensis]|uniref:hypothetical protein n=1 Tax=Streptomyces huiliensis TaxID=2876027 RepID=UPI001CBDB45A|nr:hypothetical protein [Streptomyces huiliensis]MBZ4321203.1 hypothetical protein [Streptomyces huiliensis]